MDHSRPALWPLWVDGPGQEGRLPRRQPLPQAATGQTLQECFLECLHEPRCQNVHVGYVDIVYMEKPPPVSCMLLGAIKDPSTGCTPGNGTVVKKLVGGRPQAVAAA